MSRYFYFLHAFKLPSALIAQGLAEKNTGAKRGMIFFPANRPKGGRLAQSKAEGYLCK